jgi:predicted ATPase/class 3 adenylate cyclase
VARPSGIVTFLFTDLEGSTRQWETEPEAMRSALPRHDEILRKAIEGHGGYVFATGGDGFAAAFTRPADAVAAAAQAQAELAAEPWPPGVAIAVRMGLHTGQADERDGDYFGPTVNRAARLMAAAHGGQVLCSAATAELLADADVPLTDLGEHRLRDLTGPQRVFQLGDQRFPPLRSLDNFPTNLPSSANSFVGRREEQGWVIEALQHGRLVTITGVGGVGKTRLALQVAAELLPRFPDGAWLCELASAAHADELAQVVASALGVALRPEMTLVESVVDYLRPRRLLVILDNCEHLLEAAADLAEALLDGAPGVRVLATSREGLGLPGEQVRPLRSLPVSGQPDADDAVSLFVDRARAVAPDFELDPGSREAVVEICRRLDGIPLAIELAAARVASMTPAEIAGHLDERFRLLAGGRRRAVERHQTLRAAMEWSYSLLGERERQLFDRLGVFPATFDEAAAVGVCADGELSRWDVIDMLAALVAKSMVGVERSERHSRYQLLETLRHFARDRAEAAGELDGLRRRHATYFADFAEAAGAGMVGAGDVAWRYRVGLEMDNLRAATAWAFDSPEPGDLRLGVRILGGVLGMALADPGTGVHTWAVDALHAVDQLGPEDQVTVLAGAALDAFYLGDFPQALELSGRAVELAVPFTPSVLVATAARSMSLAASGQAVSAMDTLAEGRRRVIADGGGPWLVCGLHSLTAWLAYGAGEWDTARAEATEGLRAAQATGFPTLMASALATYARLVWSEDPDAALTAAEEAVRLVEGGEGGFVQTASDNNYSAALQTAALARQQRGEVAEAARSIRTAVAYQERQGNRMVGTTDLAVAAIVLASLEGAAEAVAVVVGALTGPLLSRFPAYIAGPERTAYEQALAVARAALGPGAFEAAGRRGAAMSFDEILAFTIGALDAALAVPAG